jgi:hypothetical protein
MTKTNTIFLTIAMFGFNQINAQNVGIGIATPLAKTHVNQTASVDGILVDHSGAAGNSLELDATGTSNASSVAWIKNATAGVGINLGMNNTSSTSPGVQILHSGDGLGEYIGMYNNAATSSGMQIDQLGLGYGAVFLMANSGAGGSGVLVNQDGTGPFSRGIEAYMDAANSAIGLGVFHSGTGRGINLSLSNPGNSDLGVGVFHSGTGRGGNISLSNAANTDIGWAVFHSGTGTVSYNQGLGTAVRGRSTGTSGRAGLFDLDNTAANMNSIGLFVLYNGTGTAGSGGGNAVEVQHNGTNGNAIDVFVGSPTVGEGSTLSGYSGLSVSQYANGVGSTGFKSAISASSFGADPTVFVSNDGNEAGYGVHSQALPGTSASSPRAFYGYSYEPTNTGLGYGGYFYGGWRGLYATVAAGGSGYGIMTGGDLGATGTKTFLIDHPLDPENKELRHYSIESNEVLNMYRGVVQLDINGEAIVALPDYFEAINKDISYQLTAIGTSSQPYIANEVANNQFKVAGAPNSKVSWTIYAKRNDATIRYFDAQGGNYTNEAREKPDNMKGKYHTPEAYGKDQSFAIDPVKHGMVEKARKVENFKQSSEKPGEEYKSKGNNTANPSEVSTKSKYIPEPQNRK